MYCPRCRFEVMARRPLGSAEVSECPGCGGLFLESEAIRPILGESDLSPASFERDRAARHCFRCSVDMMPVADMSGRLHDRCPICGAVFTERGRA